MRDILLAAMSTALLGGPAMTAEQPRPVHLQVNEEADSIELIVTGQAGAAADARFTLELESIGAGGRTTTVQSGSNAKDGSGGILLRSRVRTSGLVGWIARLEVQSAGRTYSEERSGGS